MNLANIPAELKAPDQWVSWRLEGKVNPKTGKRKKVPKNPRTGGNAQSNNPETWDAFERACKAAEERKHEGPGFVLHESDPFAAIDIDDCIIGGVIHPLAMAIVIEAASYTEISPSGKGLKIFVRGKLPKAVDRPYPDAPFKVEMYDRVRFLAVTGDHLPGTPSTINYAQPLLDRLFTLLEPAPVAIAPVVLTPRTGDQSYLNDWAEQTICYAEARLQNALDGTLHNTRLAMGKLVGGLIPHGLATYEELISRLYSARVPSSNKHIERKAIEDGISAGESSPLELPKAPAPLPPDPIEINGFVCCPDHNVVLRKAKNKDVWYCRACLEADIRHWWKENDYSILTNNLKASPMTQQPTATRQAGEIEYVEHWLSKGITARQLQAKTFKPQRHIVKGLILEGLTLIAGKPKSKKSWFMLNICEAVAMGGKALGSLDVTQGTVLYLDLESNQRRMQNRLRTTLGDQVWPDNFLVFEEWPDIQNGGIERLEEWMRLCPDTVLIVVDVMQELRPPSKPGADRYAEDRAAMKPLRQFANAHNVAVVLVHHTRKMKSDDVFDEISGSTGLTGGVDNTLVLARSPENANGGILAVRGRDLEHDEPIALDWDRFLCQWCINTNRPAVRLSDAEQAVYAVLKKYASGSEPLTPKQIEAFTDMSASTIRTNLQRLIDKDAIAKAGIGKYYIPNFETVETVETDATVETYETDGAVSTCLKALRQGFDSSQSVETATVSTDAKNEGVAEIYAPNNYRGPTGDVADPEARALVESYRERFRKAA